MYRYFLPLFLIGTLFSLLSCSISIKNELNQQGVPLQDIVVYPMVATGDIIDSGLVLSGYATPPTTPIVSPELVLEGVPDTSCSGARIVGSDVRGSSMMPLYRDGDMIKYSSGYYNCFDVKRNDIVIYHHPRELLIKRVVAVPGDNWKYLSGKIIIGGKALKNSEGRMYDIQSKMLDLYANSYPTIPKDTYLILGNQEGGTLDSSRFGLVAKQDIVGKVLNGK